MSARMCHNKRHALPDGTNTCPDCARQRSFRQKARERGLPFCEHGHGQVVGNTSPAGACLECANLGYTVVEPCDVPPGESWLDWVVVQRAMAGGPLPRRLTRREVLCMAATLRSREPRGRDTIAAWIQECTQVDVSFVHLEYLEMRWMRTDPRMTALQHPVPTLNEAVQHEVDGTLDDERAADPAKVAAA